MAEAFLVELVADPKDHNLEQRTAMADAVVMLLSFLRIPCPHTGTLLAHGRSPLGGPAWYSALLPRLHAR